MAIVYTNYENALACGEEAECAATVAARTGVPLASVAAICAHLKMGHYDEVASAQQSYEAQGSMETVFALEKDLQGALRSNITQFLHAENWVNCTK